ncbi:MAG: gliding motility-associated C-terminal domain-containing protein [Saprospiraceae bacterium]|nr:gliding motility-associated C-terminal domain-containing protein [Saprospiraceae bacterium]
MFKFSTPRVIAAFSLFFLPFYLTAQQTTKPWVCGHDAALQKARQQPGWQQRHDQIEQRLYDHSLQKTPLNAARSVQVLTLPVVFHIIHDNGSENIADAQVLAGLQQLNEAFANQAYYDQGSGVNTMIQFCLAQRTPDGQATSGITRDQSPLTEMTIESDDIALKDLNRWTPTDYINIWLVREICSAGSGCGVVGYAYFPSSHGNPEDGIVMEAEYLGILPGNTGVLVHEMGHYLGLYHTFEGGCTNNDCLADGDRVCDTPPDQSTLWVDCSASVNTCTTDAQSGFTSDQPDMILNFMDYTDFDCFHDFTAGQSVRMNWHIDNVRHSLLDSKACLSPCPNPATAFFTASATTVNVGATVNFTNGSTNASGYSWAIGSTPFSTSVNTPYTFNTAGVFTVTLTANPANTTLCNPATYSLNIEVVCPVSADFTVSNTTPVAGESVTINNLSQNAPQQEWFLNGVSQGPVFTGFTPPATGVYVIRLEAGNGLCEAVELVYLSVQDSCEQLTFQKFWGANANEQGYQAITLSDGTSLLCGTVVTGSDTDILLTKVAANGTALWHKRFGGPGNDRPRRVLALPDGGWVLAGGIPGASNNTTRPLLARFAADGSIVWQNTLPADIVINLFTDLQWMPDGNLLVAGAIQTSSTVGTAGILIKMSLDGTVIWSNMYDGIYIDWIEHVSVLPNGDIAAAGFTSSFGLNTVSIHDGLVMRFNASGALLWAKAYGSIDNEWITRVFPASDGGLMAIGATSGWNGAPGGLYLDDGWMIKLDADGNQQWAQVVKSDQNIDFGIQSALPTPDGGFIMAANDVSNIATSTPLYFKTGPTGTIEWSKIYAPPGQGRIYSVDYSPGGYLLAGYTATNGSNDAWMLKCDAAGVAGQCTTQPHELSTLPVQPTVTPGAMTTLPAPALSATNLTVTDLSLAETTPCAPDCITDGGCENTWIKRYGLNNFFEGGNNLIASSDGNFYLNGYRLDSTQLMKMTPDGVLLWSRSFKFTSGAEERVSQFFEDSDGNLVGCGFFFQNSIINGFTFKYNPASDQILWAFENPGNPQTAYLGILEKSPGGNYLTINSYHDSPSPGSFDDANLVEINRNTGQFSGLKWAYSYGTSEGFIEAQIHNGSLFTVGRYTYGGSYEGMRGALSRFDLSGNEIWSRMMFYNSNFSARLYAADFVIDDNALVTIYYGDHSGDAAFTNQIAVSKTDLDGNQIWAKLYTLGGSPEVFVKSIVATPDGYVVLASNRAASQPASVYLIKIDKNGAFLWARDYRDMFAFRGKKMLALRNNYLYFIAESTFGNGDVAVAKVSAADGLVGGNCGYPFDLGVIAEDLPLVNNDITLLRYQSPLDQLARNVSPVTVVLTPNDICLETCVNEICNNGTDDDGDGLFDCLDPDCNCTPCDGEQARFWYFGDNAGLDFATNPPTVLTNGQTFSREASSVATDILGNLLFYTDASLLYNRNHQLMPNGSGLDGHASTTQTLILPQPGSPWRFFVFTPNSFDNLFTGNGLSYSVVDMSFDGGLGDVAPGLKNIELLNVNQFTEKITATRHCNGTDWWILTKEAGNNRFRAYPLTAAGLGAPVISDVGTPGTPAFPNLIGCLKFSPDGRQVANTLFHSGGVDLFDFDNSTGQLSNPVTVIQPGMSGAYGIEYSPDGRLLYLSNLSAPSHIWQIDLEVTLANPSTLPFVVSTFAASYRYGQLQRAPDNKIYVTNTAPLVFTPSLGIINQPNLPGAACLYAEGFNISPGGANLGLPSFPQDFFPKTLLTSIEGPDSLCQVPGELAYTLTINDRCIVDSVRWTLTGAGTLVSADDEGATVQFSAAGTAVLSVIVFSECVIQVDTQIIHAIDNQSPTLDLGPDQQVCENGTVVLNAGSGFDRYKWNTGSADSTITTLFPGTYWVDVWDRCGNKQSDTVTVSVLPASVLDLGPDPLVCAGTTVTYTLPNNFTGWTWTPDIDLSCTDCPTVVVTANGAVTYVVVAQNSELCLSADTLTVFSTIDTIAVSIDTAVCSNETLLLFGVEWPADTVAVFSFTTAGGCDSLVTLTVTGIDPVQVFVQETLCPGDTLLFGGQTFTSDTLLQLVFTGENGCDSIVQLTVDLIDTGTIYLTLQGCPGGFVPYNGVDIPTGATQVFQLPGSAGECDSTLIVTVTPLTGPSLQLIDTDTLVAGDTLVLNPIPDGIGPFQWQWAPLPPPEDLSCYTCPSPVASPLDDITFTVTVTDAQGCTALDSVTLIVLPCEEPFVPNAFSPDNDGTNDWFYIIAPECVVQVHYLRIYARWGELVFERSNFPANVETLGWDGNFRGKKFPSDVLVWLAEIEMPDGTVLRKKGDVTLLR